MKTSKLVTVETSFIQQMKIFNIGEKLISEDSEGFFPNQPFEVKNNSDKEEVVRKILKIKGVSYLCFDQHSVGIQIERFYSWNDELFDSVIKIIEEWVQKIPS